MWTGSSRSYSPAVRIGWAEMRIQFALAWTQPEGILWYSIDKIHQGFQSIALFSAVLLYYTFVNAYKYKWMCTNKSVIWWGMHTHLKSKSFMLHYMCQLIVVGSSKDISILFTVRQCAWALKSSDLLYEWSLLNVQSLSWNPLFPDVAILGLWMNIILSQ